MTTDVWDEVWEEYDRRTGRAGTAAASRPASAPPPRRRRGLRRLGCLALGLGLAAGAALLTPFAMAQRLSQAVAARDAAALARHLDLGAVQAGLREGLSAQPAPPGAAGAYLDALAADIAEAWSRPAALAEVLRARGAQVEGAPQPLGPTRYMLDLPAPRAPLSLVLELREGARWQVVEVRL